MVVVMRKGPWTEQEDLQLVRFVDLFGDRRWDFIAKVSGLRGIKARSESDREELPAPLGQLPPPRPQARPHHTPRRAPHSRTPLALGKQAHNSKFDDESLWARIAQRLPGRTDNEIKNYWRTHMRKKKKAQERSRKAAASSVDHSGSLSEAASPEVEAVRELDGGITAWFEETNDGWYVDQLCGNISLPDVAMSFDEEFETSMLSPAWEYGPYSLWKIDDGDLKAYV